MKKQKKTKGKQKRESIREAAERLGMKVMISRDGDLEIDMLTGKSIGQHGS